MLNQVIKKRIDGLNPLELNELLEKYSKESKISKWDVGASSSRDISVQVQEGNAKQLKGSQRNSMTLRVWNNNNQVGITSTSRSGCRSIEKQNRASIESIELISAGK